MIQASAFYLFATLVIASGVMTIGSRNPVHSVLWLILAFFNAAGLFLMLGAEFIAMLLVIVYVGAVAVLFLFVVMMLDVDFAALRAGIARYWPLGFGLALVLLAEIVAAVLAWNAGGLQIAARAAPIAPGASNIEALGRLLYTRYLSSSRRPDSSCSSRWSARSCSPAAAARTCGRRRSRPRSAAVPRTR